MRILSKYAIILCKEYQDMHISNIKINNFRNFNELDVKFHEGLNVIVGPNNVGKSNLITAINFLSQDPNMSATVDDFNKYLLLNHVEDIKSVPPIIEIEYTFEHDLSFQDEDSAFSKLSNILVFDPITGNIESNEDNSIAHLVAKVILRYVYDYKEIDAYLNEMANVADFKGAYEGLHKLQGNFKWNFYNTTTDEIIEKKIINNIFEIDEISATRTIERITEHSKKYVNEKIKDKAIDTFAIKQDITNIIQEKLVDVKDEINKDIDEDQKQIGISNGKNKFVSTFVFDGELSDSFKYELEDDTFGFPLPLNYNGLGYNNLIYMRNLLKQKRNNDYNIILIEEPEAHLHPNMQYKLLAYIENLQEQENNDIKIKNQIFVTTHSPNITATLSTHNIILLSINRNNSIPTNKAVVLSNNFNYNIVKSLFDNSADDEIERSRLLIQAQEHLSKFLDVTRSDILFSEKIILVEGIAEKLLIPKYFKDLVKEHVSIIELGGINFNYFLPLAFNTYKKILCITDKDIEIMDEDDNGLTLNIDNYHKETNRINKMFSLLPNQIKVCQQSKFGSTFEKEIFIENYENGFEILMTMVLASNFCELIKHKSLNYWNENYLKYITNGNQRKFIGDLISKYKVLYDGDDTNKELIERMFFTNLFYHYVRNKKGDFALELFEHIDSIKIPSYIEEGVKWLNS